VTESIGEVIALLDAFGPFGLGPRESTFPDATADDGAAPRSSTRRPSGRTTGGT
jgi:hypothetical protein